MRTLNCATWGGRATKLGATGLGATALTIAALLALGVVGCGSDEGAGATADAADGTSADGASTGTASVSGNAFAFGPGGDVLGATVTAIDADGVALPGAQTLTSAGGAWRLDNLPRGKDLSFLLQKDGLATTQTRVFVLDGDLERVTFQVPGLDIYVLLADMAEVKPDPSKCQIATTVTRRGHSLYDGTGTHGEPDATVSISPATSGSEGPIYFNLIKYNTIFPDRKLSATSHDGGVLFLNATPGRYTLRATKPGATIPDIQLDCRAGVLANASPPWGLQVTAGGLEPKKPGEKGPFD